MREADAAFARARRYAMSGAGSWTLVAQVAFAEARAGERSRLALSREAFATALRLRPDDPKLLAQWAWAHLEGGDAGGLVGSPRVLTVIRKIEAAGCLPGLAVAAPVGGNPEADGRAIGATGGWGSGGAVVERRQAGWGGHRSQFLPFLMSRNNEKAGRSDRCGERRGDRRFVGETPEMGYHRCHAMRRSVGTTTGCDGHAARAMSWRPTARRRGAGLPPWTLPALCRRGRARAVLRRGADGRKGRR